MIADWVPAYSVGTQLLIYEESINVVILSRNKVFIMFVPAQFDKFIIISYCRHGFTHNETYKVLSGIYDTSVSP